jgi:hypothetical protein
MGSGVTKPSFVKIDYGIQKLIGGIHGHTDSMVIAQANFHFFKRSKEG